MSTSVKDVLLYLTAAWGLLSGLFFGSFFLAGEWAKWVTIRDNYPRFVQTGQTISLRSGTYYLVANPGSGKAETGVILGGVHDWAVERSPR